MFVSSACERNVNNCGQRADSSRAATSSSYPVRFAPSQCDFAAPSISWPLESGLALGLPLSSSIRQKWHFAKPKGKPQWAFQLLLLTFWNASLRPSFKEFDLAYRRVRGHVDEYWSTPGHSWHPQPDVQGGPPRPIQPSHVSRRM